MTKEEWRAVFAAAALAGERAFGGFGAVEERALPKQCFNIADAMLAEWERLATLEDHTDAD